LIAFGVYISASIVWSADEPDFGCDPVECNVLNYPRYPSQGYLPRYILLLLVVRFSQARSAFPFGFSNSCS